VTNSMLVKYRLYQIYRRENYRLSQRGRISRNKVCSILSKDKAFKEAMPEFKDASAKTIANNLVVALKRRRENILHRWRVRATLRQIAASPDADAGDLPPGWFGDTPHWPGAYTSFKKYRP